MLDITFSNSGGEREQHFDLISTSNIKNKYIRVNNRVNSNDVAISFIGYPRLDEDDIQIIENEEIGENNPQLLNIFSAKEVNAVSLPVKLVSKTQEFLLTDVYNEYNGTLIPLWYKHSFSDTPVFSIRIIDQNQNEVDSKDWKIDGNNVFHNLRNEIVDGELKYYLISFQDSVGINRLEILQGNHCYTRRELGFGFYPTVGEREYTIDVNIGGSTYDISVYYKPNKANVKYKLFFKPEKYGQIKAYKDFIYKKDVSWHLSFSVGSIFRTVGNSNKVYYPIEYYQQLFWNNRKRDRIRESSFLESEAEAFVQDKRTIKSRFFPIYQSDDDDCYIDVIIKTENGVFKDGYTTNPNGKDWIDPFSRDIYSLRIARRIDSFSVDLESGTIRLPEDLSSTDRVFVYSKYIEKYYKYKKLNINPVLNKDIENNKVVFYIKPREIDRSLLRFYPAVESESPKLHHLIVDQSDFIVDSSETLDLLEDNSYTEFKLTYSDYLLLSEVFISLGDSIEDLQLIDVRQPGGGIKEQFDLPSLSVENPQINHFYDFGGFTLPLMEAYYVRLPIELKKGFGGELSEEQIRELVIKHMSFGGYPIIEYQGEKPEFTEAYTFDNKLILKWAYNYEADYFRVYYLDSLNDRVLLKDSIQDNETEIDITLESDSSILVSVVPVVNSEEGVFSDEIKVII